MSEPKKVPPGHPDYDMEFERCRWEMAMDGAASQDVDAWARATYESGEPILSERSRVEASQADVERINKDLEGMFLRDDTQKRSLLMNLHDKGVVSTQTLMDKLGLCYDAEVERTRFEGSMADMSLEQSRKANEESRDRTSEAISKLAAPAMVGGGVVYGTTTTTATTGTTIIGATSSTGMTITFSGGYIIGYGTGYGTASVTEAPKEPKQWRGSVHGMVRVEE